MTNIDLPNNDLGPEIKTAPDTVVVDEQIEPRVNQGWSAFFGAPDDVRVINEDPVGMNRQVSVDTGKVHGFDHFRVPDKTTTTVVPVGAGRSLTSAGRSFITGLAPQARLAPVEIPTPDNVLSPQGKLGQTTVSPHTPAEIIDIEPLPKQSPERQQVLTEPILQQPKTLTPVRQEPESVKAGPESVTDPLIQEHESLRQGIHDLQDLISQLARRMQTGNNIHPEARPVTPGVISPHEGVISKLIGSFAALAPEISAEKSHAGTTRPDFSMQGGASSTSQADSFDQLPEMTLPDLLEFLVANAGEDNPNLKRVLQLLLRSLKQKQTQSVLAPDTLDDLLINAIQNGETPFEESSRTLSEKSREMVAEFVNSRLVQNLISMTRHENDAPQLESTAEIVPDIAKAPTAIVCKPRDWLLDLAGIERDITPPVTLDQTVTGWEIIEDEKSPTDLVKPELKAEIQPTGNSVWFGSPVPATQDCSLASNRPVTPMIEANTGTAQKLLSESEGITREI